MRKKWVYYEYINWRVDGLAIFDFEKFGYHKPDLLLIPKLRIGEYDMEYEYNPEKGKLYMYYGGADCYGAYTNVYGFKYVDENDNRYWRNRDLEDFLRCGSWAKYKILYKDENMPEVEL